MTWEESNASVAAKYQQCKRFVKDHPAETVMWVIGIGLGDFGVYRLCSTPQVKVLFGDTLNGLPQRIATVVSRPGKISAEFTARGITGTKNAILSMDTSGILLTAGSFHSHHTSK